MKLWDKGYSIDQWVESFTVGKDRELDLYLAKWDVIGSLAHIAMLNSIDLLPDEDLEVLNKELKTIYSEIEKGNFTISDGVEDVHSQVEILLTTRIGDSGKKIHSGRSRNDQVLVDLRLYFRSEIEILTQLVSDLFGSLINLSEKHQNVLMPGYTHMQVAMPSSFGLWFSAYAESLIEDLYILRSAWDICNQNPLGSAAGYGSSFPLDREMTTRLLGFEDLTYNSITAQMGRGKTEKSLAFGLSSIAGTLGKFAMDICLYNGQNFNFFKLPKELTTGSSIMPHKTNPDVFEIMRGKCNLVQALPNTLSQLLANLPAGYHRDLQLLKEEIIPKIEVMKGCLQMANYAVSKMEVNEELINDPRYDYLFTVEEVNKLVEKGIPFREAYKEIGKQIEEGTYQPTRDVHHTHDGSIGNLSLDKMKQKMNKTLEQFNFESVEAAILGLVK